MKNEPLNQDLQDAKPGTLDLVCFSHLRWNFVYQRPQHLMSRSARERRVFFVKESESSDAPAHIRMEKDPSGVTVVKPYLPFWLNEKERTLPCPNNRPVFYKKNNDYLPLD